MNPDLYNIIATIENMISVIYVANHGKLTPKEQARFERVLAAAHTYDHEGKTLLEVKDDTLTIAQSYMNICDLLPFIDPDMWDRVKQVKEFYGDFSMKAAAEY